MPRKKSNTVRRIETEREKEFLVCAALLANPRPSPGEARELIRLAREYVSPPCDDETTGPSMSRRPSMRATGDTTAAGNNPTEPDTAIAGETTASGACDDLDTNQLLQQISAGEVDVASDLSVDARRACVAELSDQGFAISEIATLLRVSSRTVNRDRRFLRHAEAIEPSLRLSDELLGEMHRLTQASVQRLTRMANDETAPAYARLWAEDAMTRAYKRFIDTANELRYLRGGGERLSYLESIDPDRHKRTAARTKADFESLRAMLPGTG